MSSTDNCEWRFGFGQMRFSLSFQKEVSLKSLHEYSYVQAVILGMGMLGLSATPSHARPDTGGSITVQYQAQRDDALLVHEGALCRGGVTSN